jgi:hypothetical protein
MQPAAGQLRRHGMHHPALPIDGREDGEDLDHANSIEVGRRYR